MADAARRGGARRPLPHDARAARRGQPARRAHARPARGDEPRRGRPAPDAALAPALDDGDPARAERRAARRARPRRRRARAGWYDERRPARSRRCSSAAPASRSPTPSSSTGSPRRSGGSTASSARSPRPSRCRTRAAAWSTPTRPRRGCSGCPTSRPCSPPTRSTSPSASRSATPTAGRSRIEELPGLPRAAGEPPEPLLTQSIYRATGELHWFLTKATALEDETGELLAVNVIEDVTEEHEAALRERFLAEAGAGARLVARLRGDAAAVAQLAVPAARRLVRDRAARRARAARSRSRSPTSTRERVAAGRALRERYPPDPDAPTGTHGGDAQRRAAAARRHPRQRARRGARRTRSSSRASGRSACARR